MTAEDRVREMKRLEKFNVQRAASVMAGTEYYQKISTTAFKDDPLVNGIDHGFNRQKLKDHVRYGVGYFGRKYNRSFIPTFGWVIMMNTFTRTLAMLLIIMETRDHVAAG